VHRYTLGLGGLSRTARRTCRRHRPVVGLFSTTTYLGGILGAAGTAVILGDGAPTIASFRVLYLAGTVAAMLGVLAAARLPTGHSRRSGEQKD
jgi:hypothetical protein